MGDTVGPATTSGTRAARNGDVGSGQLFLNDSRLALTVLNQVRYLALNRIFGVPREQANLLTFVIALGAADAAYQTGRRIVRAPFPFSGTDATLVGLVAREAAYGVAGPAARAVPFAGGLLTFALLAGVALPGARRALHRLRDAEHRMRQKRMSMYAAVGRADRARDTVERPETQT